MAIVKIEYTVKDEYIEQNIKNIKAVIQELRELNNPNVSYSAYNDGGTFIHIAQSTEGSPADVIGNLPAFKTFREMMKDHLITPPKQTNLTLVDSVDI